VDARQRAYVYKAEVAQQLGAAAAASNGGGRLGALRGVASHHLNLRQMPSGRPMSRVHIGIYASRRLRATQPHFSMDVAMCRSVYTTAA